MDPLSDLLTTLRPSGAVFYGGRVRAPWGLALPAGAAAFHAVLGGPCHVELEGGLGGALLGPGDLVLLPRGHAHALRGAPGTTALPLEAFLARAEPPATPACEPDGPTEGVTELVCGELRFEPGDAHPLLDALPPLVVVRADAAGRVPWLDHTLGFLACEARSGRPGASMLMAHLASVLFIHAVRAHLAGVGAAPGGDGAPTRSVLVALRDPGVAAALGAFHRDPGDPWTVDALARHAGMSRTAFAERFRALVGEPPLTYATRWRMHHAARLLRTERIALADIAARVGYGSEAAFNRTFKRWMRVPPGRYRRAA